MSTDELLQALYETSVGYKREDQLQGVLLVLLAKALESDDPRSGVWAELFKDLCEVSRPVDWARVKEDLRETLTDAADDAISFVLDNHERGAR